MNALHIRVEGRAGRITLNRPEALNALSHAMIGRVAAALDTWREDPAVALVLFDAAGTRAFCAGGDIAEVYAEGRRGAFDVSRRFWADEYRMDARIARYPKETRFAFVCISLEFMDKVRKSLEQAGLDDLDVVYTNTQDSEELEELVRGRDIILVSPGRHRDVAGFVDEEHILPLLYNLDDGSLKTLKQRLLELNIV